MTQPFFKEMIGMQHADTYIVGWADAKSNPLSAYQSESIKRFCVHVQFEQELFLSVHPEVSTMLKLIVSRLTNHTPKRDIVKDLALYCTKPVDELDKDIRRYLKLPPDVPYWSETDRGYKLNEYSLFRDLYDIINKHYPRDELHAPSQESEPTVTPSSSFVSQVTSASTPLTPEPEPVKELTMYDYVYNLLAHVWDKATLMKVTEDLVKYDMAYVALMKVVEQAMEIPVIEIREDIVELYRSAYRGFEYNIMEKERIAAEIAWEKRMRKKLKRLIRRQKNFKGYETPPTTSEISSHPSYKKPPPRPCVCHPQWKFNRYPKDRYGIYLANEKRFDDFSTTAAPVITDMHSESEHNNEEGANPTAGQNATNKVEEKLPGKKL